MFKVNLNRFLICFYFFSLFAILSGGLFSFIFNGTPFIIWRQLFSIIGFTAVIYYRHKIQLKEFTNVRNKLFFVGYCFLFYCILGLSFHNYSVVRVAYGLWGHIVAFHLILFPYLYSQKHNFNPRLFFLFFANLGFFFSVGLVVDSQTFIFKLLNINIESLSYITEEDLTSSRCAFLADAVSTFGVYLSFCCACSGYLLCNTKKRLKQWYYILCVLLPVIGSWFSGSRQIFVIVVFIAVFVLLYYAICVKGNKFQLIVLSIMMFVSLGYCIIPIIVSNSKIVERYKGDSDGGNETRKRQWRDGSQYFLETPTALLFGNGIGSLTSVGGDPDEKIYSHYESTFLSKMVEMGVLGLYVVMLPVLLVWKYIYRSRNNDLFDYLVFILLLAYLFTSFVSPNGSHPSTQYIMYLLVGIYIIRSKYIIVRE